MSKYRVILQPLKISDPDREVKLVAVSAENAKCIANMRYGKKGYTATVAVRLGTQPSTVQTLNNLVQDFICAMDEGNREIAARTEKSFYSIMARLQKEMDVVAFAMTKPLIPDLPPLGK